MKEDDEPALSYKRVALSLLIISIFLMGTVNATTAPIVKDKESSKIKKKYKVIKGWFRPGIWPHKLPYKKYYREWINYCPYCKKYNLLLFNPKGVYEKEATCKRCDNDYDLVYGRDKSYKHSLKLKRA